MALKDEIRYLEQVQLGQIRPLCCLCNAPARLMRREALEDGIEAGRDLKTGARTFFQKFKPGAMLWYCKQHAPPPAAGAFERKPAP